MQVMVDEAFIHQADILRRARGWRHMCAIWLGAFVLVTGGLALGVIVTGYKGGESAAGMTTPVAILLYVGGSFAMAWGAAHGSKHSYAWWVAVTLAVGGVLAIGIFAVGAFGGGTAGGGDGSSSGPADPESKPQRPPELAARVADQAFVESILGTPVEGPFRVAGRAKSTVSWHGPNRSATTSGPRPLLTAQVRYRTSDRPVAPAVRRERTASGMDIIQAKGHSARWQLAIQTRAPTAAADADAFLLQRLREGLAALETASGG